jgi:tripartite-type tricarboxylate transporter receptor subunit TctC
VIANESQWTLTPAAAVMSHVNGGRLRAIGHSLPKPTELLPNIPPIAQTIPGFDYSGWQGFFLPKGTPKAINDKLREAVVKTVKSPDVKKQLDIQATEIVIRGPAEFQKVVAQSMKQNAEVVKLVGLQAN